MNEAALDRDGNRRYRVRLSVPQMEALMRLIRDEDEEPDDEQMLVGVAKIIAKARQQARQTEIFEARVAAGEVSER